MGEQIVKIGTYRVKMMCDKCKEGEMVFTGGIRTSIPDQYLHECKNCKDGIWFRDKRYPRITYFEMDEEILVEAQNED